MKVLYALESIRTPWLDTVMAAITHLGEETVFMVAALFVFWCVSKRHGYYLSLIHISEPTRRITRSRMPSSA